MDFESSMRFSTVGSFFRGGDALTGYRQEEEVDSVDSQSTVVKLKLHWVVPTGIREKDFSRKTTDCFYPWWSSVAWHKREPAQQLD